MREPPLEAAERAVDAWNRSDLDGLLAELTEHVEWDMSHSDVPGEDGVYHGHDGYAEWWTVWRGTFGPTRSEIVEARALPDGRLFTAIRNSGSGELSGALVAVDYVQINTFDGSGRSSRVEVFADEARGRAAAGLDPDGGPKARRHVEIVRAVFEGMDAARDGRDPGAAFEPLAEDFETIPAAEVLGVRTYRGLDGYAEFLRTWTEPFESWTLRLERAIAAGDDRVVARGHQSGVGKGSGVPVELTFGMVYGFRDDRLASVQLFTDPVDALAAVGLAG